MPSENAALVRPTSLAGVSFVPVVSALLPASIEFRRSGCSDRVIVAHGHAPPILPASPFAPLRI